MGWEGNQIKIHTTEWQNQDLNSDLTIPTPMLFPLHCSLMTPTEPQFQGEAITVTLICHSQGILSFHQHSQCPVSAGSCSLLLHPNIQGPNSPHSKDFTKPTRPSPAFVGHSHSCNGTSASQATPAGPPPVTFSRAHCQKYHHCPQPPASAALSQRRSRNVKGVHCGILYFLLLRIFELLLFHGPIWGYGGYHSILDQLPNVRLPPI